jgi:hypothetical protein
MTGCINKMQLIGLAIFRLIGQAHGLGFNRDAALTLKIERIQELRLHLTSLQRSCLF